MSIAVTDYNYQYQVGTNRLTAIYKNANQTAVLDRTYTYDANGNLKTDTKKGMTATTYGRANLPWQITINGKNINYLYGADDQRIYKYDYTPGSRSSVENAEYYLRAGGREMQFIILKMKN